MMKTFQNKRKTAEDCGAVPISRSTDEAFAFLSFDQHTDLAVFLLTVFVTNKSLSLSVKLQNNSCYFLTSSFWGTAS